jgi:hypothetical protein
MLIVIHFFVDLLARSIQNRFFDRLDLYQKIGFDNRWIEIIVDHIPMLYINKKKKIQKLK